MPPFGPPPGLVAGPSQPNFGVYERVKVKNGDDEVFGEDGAEVFVVSASSRNAETIRFFDFEFGTDQIQFGSRNSTDTQFAWIEDGGDGEENDLQITIGDQVFILVDVADQIEFEPINRLEQGFEVDTGQWSDADDGWFGQVTRVASGTGGVSSAEGDYHAVIEGANGTAPFNTLLNQGAVAFEEYTVSIDVYLDPQADGGSGWADGEGFDYSVSTNQANDVDFYADYIFHVTQDTSSGEMYIGASNNTNFAPREDLDTLSNNAIVSEDGWYTFEHRFYEAPDGELAVDMSVMDSDGNIIFTETKDDTRDGSGIDDSVANINGEARYAWFTAIEVDGGLPADNLEVEYASDQVPPLPTEADIFFV